jgi:hypothetical protein
VSDIAAGECGQIRTKGREIGEFSGDRGVLTPLLCLVAVIRGRIPIGTFPLDFVNWSR